MIYPKTNALTLLGRPRGKWSRSSRRPARSVADSYKAMWCKPCFYRWGSCSRTVSCCISARRHNSCTCCSRCGRWSRVAAGCYPAGRRWAWRMAAAGTPRSCSCCTGISSDSPWGCWGWGCGRTFRPGPCIGRPRLVNGEATLIE